MILFPDTHFFLHFKDAPELPWAEITSDPEVRLIVCRTVQREIDRKEHELHGRPQRKARKVATQLADLAVAGEPLVLREGKPRVTLEFFYLRPGERTASEGLNPMWGDDVIIAEVLAFAVANGESGTVLTNDIGVYHTARDHGVEAFLLRRLPNWLLPDEPDPLGKENAKLKHEIAALRNTSPAIDLKLLQLDEAADNILIDVVTYPPLSADKVDTLMADLTDRQPLVKDFSKDISNLWAGLPVEFPSLGDTYEDRPPSSDDIRAYTEEAYPAWMAAARGYLENLHNSLNTVTAGVSVRFQLFNNGTVPADRVRLELKAMGGALLATLPGENEKEAEETPLALPVPPDPPAWTRVVKPGILSSWKAMSQIPGLPDFLSRGTDIEALFPLHRFEPKPHEFYWTEPPAKIATEWVLACEDFRHQPEPTEFSARIFVYRKNLPAGNAVVQVTLSARNLHRQFIKAIPVKILRQDGDIESQALRLMPHKRRSYSLGRLKPKGS